MKDCLATATIKNQTIFVLMEEHILLTPMRLNKMAFSRLEKAVSNCQIHVPFNNAFIRHTRTYTHTHIIIYASLQHIALLFTFKYFPGSLRDVFGSSVDERSLFHKYVPYTSAHRDKASKYYRVPFTPTFHEDDELSTESISYCRDPRLDNVPLYECRYDYDTTNPDVALLTLQSRILHEELKKSLCKCVNLIVYLSTHYYKTHNYNIIAKNYILYFPTNVSEQIIFEHFVFWSCNSSIFTLMHRIEVLYKISYRD